MSKDHVVDTLTAAFSLWEWEMLDGRHPVEQFGSDWFDVPSTAQFFGIAVTDYLHVAVAWTPVTRTIWVSAIFVAVPPTIARLIFNRRDVATTSQPTTPPPRAPHSTRAT